MTLKDYQEKAVRNLLQYAIELLDKPDNKTIVFKAPTGSGKTIMGAEFLARLADSSEKPPLSFIWVAPRSLHKQSYNKLERYYEDSRALECLYFEDLTNNEIGENEILFVNWESIRLEDKNTIVRENEHNRNLGNVLENTKAAGREVVLLIDESHFHANAETSQNLIKDIAPKLTVEISATPTIANSADKMESVSLEDVKLEQMIKASVIINDATNEGESLGGRLITLSESSDKVLLNRALKKREDLVAAYGNANINPLLCIQLPDRRLEQDDTIREEAEKLLYQKGIKIENGKLAIWLSGEKENCDGIDINYSEVEVLIFKQAIALGWDCPRAQILVLFRNLRSIVFSVQTLGRIMRMPELRYYENDVLNNAYVYTNLPKAEIHEDVAGGYVHIYTATRIAAYKNLKLKSVNRIRQREQTRLSPRFVDLFLDAAAKYRLNNKIKTKNQIVESVFIENYKISGIDEIAGKKIDGEVRVNLENELDLQKLFDYFARDNLAPYYPEDRSVNRIKQAIYRFFEEVMGIELVGNFKKIVSITLSENNRRHFVQVINWAKDAYGEDVQKRKAKLHVTSPWEIPEKATYGKDYNPKPNIKKSVLLDFHEPTNQSTPEKEFIGFLEESTKVKWWYKNGESNSLYFAVPYTENGEEHPFYVDFIVHFKGGKIGLFDTKSGFTLMIAGNKSDGLRDYIHKQNKDRQKRNLPLLIGGIVRKSNAGVWSMYVGKGKDINNNNSSDWESLDWN